MNDASAIESQGAVGPDPDSRYVVVLSREDSAKYVQGLNEEDRRKHQSNLSYVAELAADAAKNGLWYAFLPTAVWSAWKAFTPKAMSVIDNIKVLRDAGVAINLVTFDVGQCMRISGGRVKANTLYIGHPFKPNLYFTAAQYNLSVFQETFAELLIYFRSFGPRKIEIYMSQQSSDLLECQSSVVNSVATSESARKNAEIIYSCEWDLSESISPDVDAEGLNWIADGVVVNVVNSESVAGARSIEFEMVYHEEFGFNDEFKTLTSVLKDKVAISFGGRVDSKKGTRLKSVLMFREEDESGSKRFD